MVIAIASKFSTIFSNLDPLKNDSSKTMSVGVVSTGVGVVGVSCGGVITVVGVVVVTCDEVTMVVGVVVVSWDEETMVVGVSVSANDKGETKMKLPTASQRMKNVMI